jgi:hypothetical protein
MNHFVIGISPGATTDIVVLNFALDMEHPQVEEDSAWKLPSGHRPEAYHVLYGRIENLLKRFPEATVGIIASQTTGLTANIGILHTAEIRGVISVASYRSNASVFLIDMQAESKKIGKITKEWEADDLYWEELLSKQIAKGRRRAAIAALHAWKVAQQ